MIGPGTALAKEYIKRRLIELLDIEVKKLVTLGIIVKGVCPRLIRLSLGLNSHMKLIHLDQIN